MSDLLHPNDLKQISSDAEMAKMDEEQRAKRAKDEQQAELREAFMNIAKLITGETLYIDGGYHIID